MVQYFGRFIRELDAIRISEFGIVNQLYNLRKLSYTQLCFILNNDFYLRTFIKIIIKKRFMSELLMNFCKDTQKQKLHSYRYTLLTFLSSKDKIIKIIEAIKKYRKAVNYYEEKNMFIGNIDIMAIEYSGLFKRDERFRRDYSSAGQIKEYSDNLQFWIDHECPAMVMDVHHKQNSCPP